MRAYTTETSVCLGYRPCDVKSNEITAIPKLLKALNLKDSLISMDAMGCQSAILTQIVEQGADYLVTVKANQPSAHEALGDQCKKLQVALATLNA